jgi:hypothetical protein
MPANLIAFAHFPVTSEMTVPKAAGEPPPGGAGDAGTASAWAGDHGV